MPHTEPDEEDSPLHLVLLFAIAGRLDAQQRLLLAQKLDNERFIYHAFAVFDSLSLSNSMFKYFFEICTASTNPDWMHQFLTSPAGIVTITSEFLFLISFSLMASLFEDEKKNEFKKMIAQSWPYVRDMMKGLKNAYKGWRSSLQIIRLLFGYDLSHLLIPVGLSLGIITALNRYYLQHLKNQGEVTEKYKINLLKEILEKKEFCPKQRSKYFNEIHKVSYHKLTYITANLLAGFIDGIYFYMGVLCLAPLPSFLFIALLSLTLVYVVINIINRLYEGYLARMKVLRSQITCELALITWEIDFKEDVESEQHAQYRDLKKQLDNTHSLNYITAGINGIKHGIFAYGVMSGVLFILGNLFTLAGISFPPALLTVFIFSGLAFIISFTAFMLWQHHKDQTGAKNKFFIKERTEILRGISSGLSKGYNLSNFILTPFQEKDSDEHYHESTLMIVFALINSVVFAVIWGFKSFAKEFGKQKPEQAEIPKPRAFGESSELPVKALLDIPKKNCTLLTHSIFKNSSPSSEPSSNHNSCCQVLA